MIESLNNVSFHYVIDKVLNNVSFVVNEKEKWGVVGRNGSGKSTLLKILAEEIVPDSGEVFVLRKYKISYCPQSMEFENGKTIYETVSSKMKEETEVFQIKSILTKLGLSDYDRLVDKLSGGEKKRVALAISLIREADLYLLDEPTNHLDQDMILWLEKYLTKMKKAIVMVSHDRYFLSRITDHMVEVDNGHLYTYEGNYADYLEKREERYATALLQDHKRKVFLSREIEWIRAGCQARTTKQKGRIQRFEKLSEVEDTQVIDTLNIQSASSRLGGKTIEIENLAKAFGDKKLFDGFNYRVNRDDRVGIIGGNGSGKSTFLKIIKGDIRPDKGIINIGETVKIGYFGQMNNDMPLNKRVIDYMEDFGKFVYTADGEMITASKMLEKFLFKKDHQYNPIEKCSGGEIRRLYLCTVLMQAPNILLLDEPTNDLDTDTLTILENYLEDFKGAVLTVSHDRYFLDRVCDRLFLFENGDIKILDKGYSEYLEGRVKENNEPVKEAAKYVQPKRVKLSFNEQREFDKLEKELPGYEEKVKELENKLNKVSDFNEINMISKELEKANEELEEVSLRYMELLEKSEGNV